MGLLFNLCSQESKLNLVSGGLLGLGGILGSGMFTRLPGIERKIENYLSRVQSEMETSVNVSELTSNEQLFLKYCKLMYYFSDVQNYSDFYTKCMKQLFVQYDIVPDIIVVDKNLDALKNNNLELTIKTHVILC